MTHPAVVPGHVAVITGAASGIGLAAAQRLAALGMAVVHGRRERDALEREAAALPRPAPTCWRCRTDVSDPAQVEALRDAAMARWGPCRVLMNNAGRESHGADRRRAGGVAHDPGDQSVGRDQRRAGVPAGDAGRRAAGAIINTGSKQGITTPPGNTAYNVSKAGVKVLTEALAHDLLGTAVTAHLLIPGFTFTGLTRSAPPTKPAGAWTPEQVVDFMLDAMARGDFYILCPDNDTTRAHGREAHALGDGRRDPEPPGAVPLASGPCGRVQGRSWRMSAPHRRAAAALAVRRPLSLAGAGATVALLASAGLVLLLGQGLRHLIDGGFASGSPARLNATAAAMAGVIALLAVATASRFALVTWLGERIGADLRRAVFDRVMTLSPAWFETARIGRRAVPPAGGHRGAAGAGRVGAVAMAALRPAAGGRVRHAGGHLAAAVRPGGGGGAVRGGAAGRVLPPRARAVARGAGAAGRPGRAGGGDARRAAHRAGVHARSRSPAPASPPPPSSRWPPPARASAPAPG